MNKGEPYLWLDSPSGHSGAMLYMHAQGPQLTLYDPREERKVIWHAP